MKRAYAVLLVTLLLVPYRAATAESLGNLPTGEPIQRYSTKVDMPSRFEYAVKHVEMVLKTVIRIIKQFGPANGVNPSDPLSERESECIKWRTDMFKRKLEYEFAAYLDASSLAAREANYSYSKLMTEFWCGGGRGGRALAIFDNYQRDNEDQMVEDLTRERTSDHLRMVKLGLAVVAYTQVVRVESIPKNISILGDSSGSIKPDKVDTKPTTTTSATVATLVALGIAFSLGLP